ncbi:hypothetical protein ACT009_16010 [Sphingomonas sp. Tas61C01]|uniref:hypothetical protein n=1 Tax=Sphingomonas sp. Tas61C01 TaxID=3458297 RepID=UPI00403E51A1
MRKTLTIVAAVAAALTSTIGMAAEGQQRFTHDGMTYVYTSKQDGNRQIIDGRRFPAGAGFHLVVRNNRVSGVSGGVPVDFALDEARGAKGAVEVAAR